MEEVMKNPKNVMPHVAIILNLTEENIQVLFEVGNLLHENGYPISSLHLFWLDCNEVKKAICADECTILLQESIPAIIVTSVTKPARQYMVERMGELLGTTSLPQIMLMEEEKLLSGLSQTPKAIDLLLLPETGLSGMMVLEACYAEFFPYGNKLSSNAFYAAVQAFGTRDRRLGGYSVEKQSLRN